MKSSAVATKSLPVVGRKYWMYEYPSLNTDDLHRVKVTAIRHMCDGRAIVSYRWNGPLFGITTELELSEFKRLIEVTDLVPPDSEANTNLSEESTGQPKENT